MRSLRLLKSAIQEAKTTDKPSLEWIVNRAIELGQEQMANKTKWDK